MEHVTKEVNLTCHLFQNSGVKFDTVVLQTLCSERVVPLRQTRTVVPHGASVIRVCDSLGLFLCL